MGCPAAIAAAPDEHLATMQRLTDGVAWRRHLRWDGFAAGRGPTFMPKLARMTHRWPLLFTVLGVILTFCCSAPIVWLLSNLLVDTMRTLVQ
jgi:hypothetical protein